MTYAEYKEKVDKLLTNPDTALAGIEDIYKELEADLTTKDSLEAEVNTLRDQVSALRETNIKLYMQRTGEAPEQDGEEITEEDGEKYIDKVFDDVMKEEE